MRYLRVLVALILPAMLLLVSTAAENVAEVAVVERVEAYEYGSCPSTDFSQIILYENRIGNTSGGDDRVHICASIPDLTNVLSYVGPCNGNFGTEWFGTWNNCASSFNVRVPGAYWACLYWGYNYQSTMWSVYNPGGPGGWIGRQNAPAGFDDSLSSIRWVSGSTPGDC